MVSVDRWQQYKLNYRLLPVIACMLLLFFYPRAVIAEASYSREVLSSAAMIKSAFLMKFCLYVQWPSEKFIKHDASLVIGVAGNYNDFKNLKYLSFNKKLSNRGVVVVQATPGDNLDLIHVLYIPDHSEYMLSQFQEKSNLNGVLVVTDTHESFAKEHGMINFVEVEGKIKFDINQAMLKSAGLGVGAELLSVSRKIILSSRDKQSILDTSDE